MKYKINALAGLLILILLVISCSANTSSNRPEGSTAVSDGSLKVAVLDFEPEERASRTTATQMMNSRRGDFITIFQEYPQYDLISMDQASRTLSTMGITSVRALTSQMAANIGNELAVDIVIWGSISEISATEVRMLANVMLVRSQNINQLRFNLGKRSADRIAVLKRELIDKLADFSREELERLINIGEQQLSAQNFTGARTTFQRILQIDPQYIDACYYLGYISFMLNDFDAAIEYCQIGLDIDPTDERILNSLAESKLQAGMYDEAIDTLKELADLRPTDELIWIRIANIYYDINATFESIEAFKKALEINPESEIAHYRIGVMLFDNNEIPESIPHLEYIAERHPEDDNITRKLTAAYMRTGQLDQAIQNYRTQIERNPRNVTAYLNLAGAQRTKNQNRDALATLNKLVAFEKENPTVFIRLADVNIALNNINAAETNANTARRLDENLYEPYTMLAQINQIRGYSRYESFIELEERAQTLFGREADEVIAQRDRARNEANELFQASDRMLATALTKTTEPSVIRDINARRQLLTQLINETRPTFFD